MMDYVVPSIVSIHIFYYRNTSRSDDDTLWFLNWINKICRKFSSTDEFDSVSNTGNLTAGEFWFVFGVLCYSHVYFQSNGRQNWDGKTEADLKHILDQPQEQAVTWDWLSFWKLT